MFHVPFSSIVPAIGMLRVLDFSGLLSVCIYWLGSRAYCIMRGNQVFNAKANTFLAQVGRHDRHDDLCGVWVQ